MIKEANEVLGYNLSKCSSYFLIIGTYLAMWQTPVLCVTQNGQFFQMFAPHTRWMGRFLDVVSCNIKRYKKQWVCDIPVHSVENRVPPFIKLV